jgi:hypothetical protein
MTDDAVLTTTRRLAAELATGRRAPPRLAALPAFRGVGPAPASEALVGGAPNLAHEADDRSLPPRSKPMRPGAAGSRRRTRSSPSRRRSPPMALIETNWQKRLIAPAPASAATAQKTPTTTTPLRDRPTARLLSGHRPCHPRHDHALSLASGSTPAPRLPGSRPPPCPGQATPVTPRLADQGVRKEPRRAPVGASRGSWPEGPRCAAKPAT